jgi:hypothetical protein
LNELATAEERDICRETLDAGLGCKKVDDWISKAADKELPSARKVEDVENISEDSAP